MYDTTMTLFVYVFMYGAGNHSQIGSVPTPWPSWLIAAHPTRATQASLRAFLDTLSEYIRRFDAEENRRTADVEFIKAKFGYPEEDIQVHILLFDLPCSTDRIA